MTRILLVSFFVAVSSTAAHAHWGHVGEVAGHGHLIGLGAVVAAGALAGVVAVLAGKKKQKEPEELEDEAGEGEAA